MSRTAGWGITRSLSKSGLRSTTTSAGISPPRSSARLAHRFELRLFQQRLERKRLLESFAVRGVTPHGWGVCVSLSPARCLQTAIGRNLTGQVDGAYKLCVTVAEGGLDEPDQKFY